MVSEEPGATGYHDLRVRPRHERVPPFDRSAAIIRTYGSTIRPEALYRRIKRFPMPNLERRVTKRLTLTWASVQQKAMIASIFRNALPKMGIWSNPDVHRATDRFQSLRAQRTD